MNTLVISLLPEGATDIRFLSNIIIRTAFDILIEKAEGQIDVSDLIILNNSKKNGRDNQILQAAKDSYGYHILIVHSDADDNSDKEAFDNRINPWFSLVEEEIGKICKNLVPIVPIRMTEAWMIADKNTLKEEIGTDKDDHQLELNFPIKNVEIIADPKEKIKKAIQVACIETPYRLARINIADLYLPLGQKVDLSILNHLGAYRKFKKHLTEAFKKINYIH
jgi:hypothetical protein